MRGIRVALEDPESGKQALDFLEPDFFLLSDTTSQKPLAETT